MPKIKRWCDDRGNENGEDGSVSSIPLGKLVVVNVGCIECGVDSNIVGIFTDEKRAEEIAALCAKKYHWRDGGQNHFDVFPVPEDNVVQAEYVGINEGGSMTKCIGCDRLKNTGGLKWTCSFCVLKQLSR
jgi:hypothetical protein